jgi:hypothetical protein
MDLLEPYDSEKYWEQGKELIGFPLPAAFVQHCEAARRGEAPEEWVLRENVDAYGNPWENFGLMIYLDPDVMAEETHHMVELFREEGIVPQDEADRNKPGFVQDFTDIANYVRFGTNNVGEMFCFDFGADPEAPSVVSFPSLDRYWRRVAPNFETFIALFIDEREAPPQPDDEEFEVVQPTPRTLLAGQVQTYVVAPPELRRFVLLPAGYYAQCSAEERREVEAEVREELERRGMTDEQRRRLEEVWHRLRFSRPS